MLVFGVFDLH